jgi:hypothetical protein
VHVLDDDKVPEGPVLCGKTSTQVLGKSMEKGDVLCRKCAIALLARADDYADQIDDLSTDLAILVRTGSEQRRALAKRDRMLVKLMERRFDEDEKADWL